MNAYKNIDISLLLLRLTFGGAMLYGHGFGKLIKLFTESPIKFGDPIGLGMEASLALAVFAEVVCAILLIFGLFTRFATIPLIITMLVAIFFVHLQDPFNKIEKALLFLIPYVCLLLMGGGYYSVDRWWRNR